MKTVNISGFGGGYEWTCQRMLANGYKWLQANCERKKHIDYQGFKGVYGLCEAVGDISREFDEAIMENVSDATGAMHHAVVAHLAYMSEHSWEQWVHEVETDQPERVFDFDGTMKSCPAPIRFPEEIEKTLDGLKQLTQSEKIKEGEA